MTNKKAPVFGETKGLIKSYLQKDSKSFPNENQDVCSFCLGEMIDDSIRFKGIAACSECLRKLAIFDANLRNYFAVYRRRFGVRK
jgi:hypothetical protein